MTRRLAVVLVAGVVLAFASGAAYAASRVIPTSGVFNACYDAGGSVKVIDPTVSPSCPKGWTGPVAWNAQGYLGIHNVYFIGEQYGEPGGSVLRFWMETGVSSEACLVTMGEANHAPGVDGIYCSSRNVILADGAEHWGVAVTLMLAGPLEDDPGGDPAWYSVNVVQEGAVTYGDPLPCFGLTGCS